MNKKVIIGIIGLALVVVVFLVFMIINWLTTSGHDYTKLTWAEAFDQLHAQISLKYPFTDWKEIDWDAKYAHTAPLIMKAEAENDPEAYYLALREYAWDIPDAHVQLGGPDLGLRMQAIEGGYGFGIIGLDDSRVIAHLITPDGPAEKAGMLWGAEIVEWNGLSIKEALNQTSTIWASNPQATTEGHRLEQFHFLTRDPIGTETKISYRNTGDESIKTVTLIAETDQLETLQVDLMVERDLQAIFEPPVQYEVLDEGVGYIRITGFMPTLGGVMPSKIFDKAIKTFLAAKVSGIIIDVRNNGGGLDALVPDFVGHFFTEQGFYEQVSIYDEITDQFEIDLTKTLTIEPRKPYFDGPVIVLVDKYTFSTAEGIPMAIQALPQGYVAGIYGTNGSFALGDPGINLYRLPNELGFTFFEGRGLDEEMKIQIDGNAEGVGGVVPDLRVPLTDESVYRMYVEGVDIVLEFAIEALEEKE